MKKIAANRNYRITKEASKPEGYYTDQQIEAEIASIMQYITNLQKRVDGLSTGLHRLAATRAPNR